jgi:hypothetical protein
LPLLFCLLVTPRWAAHAFGIDMLSAEELIGRNRRLLARAEAARAWKRLIVEEIAENSLRLHVTLVGTVHPHYGRTGFLSEMIYLRQLIAERTIAHAAPAGET